MSILHASDLRVSFGGVHAVKGVTIELVAGQLVGLIGPNGAGKTTIIDALSGFVSSSGEIAFDGAELCPIVAQLGFRLPQGRLVAARIDLGDHAPGLDHLPLDESEPDQLAVHA